jgi:SAM-dependent methyltransferase
MTRVHQPRFDAGRIRRYYDRHTPAWVAFGPGGSAGAIHRAVWGPGVGTRAQAFRYVEDRIVEHLLRLRPSFGASHVVDLGCGVGGSLCYLAGRLPVRGTGITLSPVQARFAAERVREAACADRVRCLVGDYCDLPAGLAPADLAFAIESFVHGPDPARFFAQCRDLIRPGGLLLVCDDFRRASTAPAARRAIDRFCRGWQVNTLLRADELQSLAREAGFAHESTIDLTPYLELGRLRDRVVDALAALTGWLPWYDTRAGYLLGGSALQTCLAKGWIGYDLALFRRL